MATNEKKAAARKPSKSEVESRRFRITAWVAIVGVLVSAAGVGATFLVWAVEAQRQERVERERISEIQTRRDQIQQELRDRPLLQPAPYSLENASQDSMRAAPPMSAAPEPIVPRNAPPEK